MVQIAGGIIMNPERKVAVVNQFRNSWSLPKGHIERGESPLLAAIREIKEETGIRDEELRFIRPLGSYIRNKISKDGRSEVANAARELHLFLFETPRIGDLFPEDPDNPEARWVPIAEVPGILTHPKDKAFFRSIADIIVVPQFTPIHVPTFA